MGPGTAGREGPRDTGRTTSVHDQGTHSGRSPLLPRSPAQLAPHPPTQLRAPHLSPAHTDTCWASPGLAHCPSPQAPTGTGQGQGQLPVRQSQERDGCCCPWEPRASPGTGVISRAHRCPRPVGLDMEPLALRDRSPRSPRWDGAVRPGLPSPTAPQETGLPVTPRNMALSLKTLSPPAHPPAEDTGRASARPGRISVPSLVHMTGS